MQTTTKNPKTCIMFGDSITEHGNWSNIFENVKIINQGISGDTTRNLLMRFDRSIDTSADIVFIMAGINDLVQKKSIEATFSNYVTILEKLQMLKIQPIVQLTLFVGEEFHNFYPSINYNVEKLNSKLINYCNETNIKYIDINKILSEDNILKSEYTSDSVHLNKKAYNRWNQYLKGLI